MKVPINHLRGNIIHKGKVLCMAHLFGSGLNQLTRILREKDGLMTRMEKEV